MLKLSNRIEDLPISSIRKLTPYAEAAEKTGVKVYHLNIGDPDIKTPKVMLNALKEWKGDTLPYAQSNGESSLITALLDYYHKLGYKKLKYEDLLITVGGSEACVMALFAACEVGDEVLVFEPFYSNYASQASFVDVKLVAVPTSIRYGFHLPSKEQIEKKITKKTKAILICSPNNPTGVIYTKAELKLLVDIAKKHNLYLICDEVYREFTFDNKTHTSILDFLHIIPSQIILLDSLSKRYSLCGARVGVLASLNKELMANTLKIAQSRLSANLITQIMAAKITEVPASYSKTIVKEYQDRRDVIFEGLSKIDGVFLTKPEGAFYTIVSLPVEDAEKFAIFLLKEFRLNNETVMLAPGQGFYQTPGEGSNRVRIAYVLNIPDLKKCIKIIDEGLKAYKKSH